MIHTCSNFRRFLTRSSSSQLESDNKSDRTDLENQDTLLHSTPEATYSLPTHSNTMLNTDSADSLRNRHELAYNTDSAETLRNRRELAYMAAARRMGQTDRS